MTEEDRIRHDERKKIIAQGCIHTRKAGESADYDRPDLSAWQDAQSEYFDPTILEIVSEYAAWRDAQEARSVKRIEDGHADTEGEAMESMAHLNCPSCGGSGHVDDTDHIADGGKMVRDFIAYVAKVSEVIGFQAGVGGRETAGAIIGFLAQHPDKLDVFMKEGVFGWGDTEWITGGCLTWQANDGKVWHPDDALAARAAKAEGREV